MKRTITLSLLTLICFFEVAQTVTLTYTGRDADNRYVKLDRVVVNNYTRGWQKTLTWPDTTLTLKNTANMIVSSENEGFALSQNNPNPFVGTTDVHLTVADAGTVTLDIVDGNGKIAVEPISAMVLIQGKLVPDGYITETSSNNNMDASKDTTTDSTRNTSDATDNTGTSETNNTSTNSDDNDNSGSTKGFGIVSIIIAALVGILVGFGGSLLIRRKK